MNFHFNKKIEILLRLVPFQNQVAEIRVEYMDWQFLDPCSSPHTEKCGGIRIGAHADFSDVNTTSENF